MISQNTWPESWENFSEPFEKSKNYTTIRALEKKWLQANIAKRLWALQWEIDSQKIAEIYAAEYPWENKQKEIAQVWDWLNEHRKNVLDLAEFERSEFRKTLNKNEDIHSSWDFSYAITRSLKTIWILWKDLSSWVIESFKNPKESVFYTFNQANRKLTQAELDYIPWKMST